MHRFFIGRKFGKENLLWLSPEESRHAVKVLRLKKGEAVLAFDADSHEYEARIGEIDSEGRVQIEILKERKRVVDDICIHIAQGFLQKQKMDWIVEKACEIAINGLYPLESEFSMVHPKAESVQKIEARWHRIAEQAAKQSGNVQLPEISDPLDFQVVMKKAEAFDLKFLFHPKQADLDLKSAIEKVRNHSKPAKVFLFIGPEGGFSRQEVRLAQDSGFQIVGLGQNILRAETAFVVLAGIFKILTL